MKQNKCNKLFLEIRVQEWSTTVKLGKSGHRGTKMSYRLLAGHRGKHDLPKSGVTPKSGAIFGGKNVPKRGQRLFTQEMTQTFDCLSSNCSPASFPAVCGALCTRGIFHRV